jgi:hypothetical protein
VTRPVLLEPAGGYTPETVESALALVLADVPPFVIIQRWAPLELMVAFDWALRERWHASDNLVRRRPCPWFVGTAWRRWE